MNEVQGAKDKTPHRVLAVFAHPDDESYGPGATLARLAGEGSEVRLITFTRGESASMGDSPLFSPEFLAETRTIELDCACRALGVSSHQLLGFPDKALETIPLDDLVKHVIQTLDELRPHLVIAFHPSGISGHPDHQSATRAARRALEVWRPSGQAPPRLAYYVWPQSVAAKITWRTIQSVPDEEVTHAIEIGAYFENKIEACLCHKTQRYLFERMSEYPGGIEALWTHEYFTVDGQRAQGKWRSSLFEGT
jgi:LmbE family N-acetylglucosaminyl deacetylase